MSPGYHKDFDMLGGNKHHWPRARVNAWRPEWIDARARVTAGAARMPPAGFGIWTLLAENATRRRIFDAVEATKRGVQALRAARGLPDVSDDE